jgi:pyruvate/2-oxoglutarate dehydrogenase complex dihydrolipoamide acyltransferase (E2) component
VSSSRTEATGLVDITMPQMGVSVAEGTVVAWRVAVGDRIEAEQTICEISTDKIDTEVPSPVSGLVSELLVDLEQTVDVGTVLARIATEDGAGSESAGPAAADGGGAGDGGRAGEGGAGDGGAGAGGSEREVAAPAAEAPTNGSASAARGRGSGRRYSPVVMRIAAEHDIDLDGVSGTGRDGRVRKQDVLALVNGDGAAAQEPPLHIESPYRPDPPSAPSAAPARSATAAGAARSGTSVGADGAGLSRMRRQIGEHMKRSLDTAATCTTWIEVDMARVEATRARLRVTALAFVARATIDALREHPSLNAWLDGDRYTRVDDVNLGIAVSLGEDGLIVPVIHRAHELSVEGLAARIRDIARRARARELTADDVQGGTFTITNPGQYGSIMATPIINQPQVAILDLEAVVKRPVVITDDAGNDSIAIRPMTILGLSWDHRALDGALSAQFLATLKGRLQDVS